MRRTLTLLALLGVAAFWMGCSTSSPSPGDSKSTGAYNSSPSGPAPVISNTSNTSSSSEKPGSPQTGGSKPTGIKPPMKNENK